MHRTPLDEVLVTENSFLIRFPFLKLCYEVDVGSPILDSCATHNFVTVITDAHIIIAQKDKLHRTHRCLRDKNGLQDLVFVPTESSVVVSEYDSNMSDRGWRRRKFASDVILTSTLSTVYLVHTTDDSSTVVRLFNEKALFETSLIEPCVIQNPSGVRITAASSGYDHSLFLTEKGQVYALGTGSRGELGIGLVPRVCELTWVEALEGVNVVDVVASGWHSGALTVDGDVYLWGWNHRGQLGGDKEKVELYPSPLEIDIRIVRIEMKDHMTALWTAEDNDEPSILFGSNEIGMPTVRLNYYGQDNNSSSEAGRLVDDGGGLAPCLSKDRHVEISFLTHADAPNMEEETSDCMAEKDMELR